jgi:hypothetical protein
MTKQEINEEENKKEKIQLPCLIKDGIESYSFFTKEKLRIGFTYPTSMKLEELRDGFLALHDLVKKTIEDFKKKQEEDEEKNKPASENKKKNEEFKPVK